VASVKNNGRASRRALAAACAAAGLLLGACDTSNNTTTAQKTGREAAGRMMSAGEPRATDKLMTEAATGDLTALARQLTDRAKSGGGIGDYVQVNTSAKDLETAIQQLQSALALNPDIGTKVGLTMQLGAAQLQLADARAAGVESDVRTLSQLAEGLQSQIQEVTALNSQAEVLEKAIQPPNRAVMDKAKAAVAEKQKALEDLQAKVRDLQAQIASRDAQARTIYAATDAAFTAADALKGKASIDAANKAMNDRKQAEDLVAESGMLAPVLAQAQADQALAQVALNDAQQAAALATAAYDHATEDAAATAKRVDELRKAAAAVVDSEGKDENGLTKRLGKYMELAGKLDPEIRQALTAADAAAGSFNTASAGFASYISDLSKKVGATGAKSDDPLQAIVKDPRMPVLITWSKSAAEQRAGRLCLAGAQTFNQVAAVIAAAGQANVKAKSEISPEVRSYYAGEATKKFQSAMASAESGNQRKGGDLDKIRWIGLSLELTARQGASLAGNRGALEKAADLKKEALTLNPGLSEQLSWIGQ
jgi:hypothetical protein